jgi:hypothetical protein
MNDLEIFIEQLSRIQNLSEFKISNHNNISLLETQFGYNIKLLQIVGIYCHNKNIDDILIWNEIYGKINMCRITNDIMDKNIEKVDQLLKTIEIENQKIRESTMKCILCKVKRISVLSLPCGHIIVCSKCYKFNTKCLLCKEEIKENFLIYF